MRILITSVGRRVELIQAFRNAAEKAGIDLEIYGADVVSTAPAIYYCDKPVPVPRIRDAAYIPFLKQYCLDNRIDALIPTIDYDLIPLSEHKNEFGSTKVIISNNDVIRICRDKRLTGEFIRKLGLKSPETVDSYTDYNSGYPAFIKPFDGSASICAFKAANPDELKVFAARVPGYIVQPFIDGTEYTVDAFCDFEGNPVLITPRIRLAVRSGEVLKTKISQDDKIISEVKTLLAALKPCGEITVQLIREKSTGEDYFIEINPRFGGGTPLTVKAGADCTEMLLRMVKGEKLSYIEKAAEDGAVYSRFDQSVRVYE